LTTKNEVFNKKNMVPYSHSGSEHKLGRIRETARTDDPGDSADHALTESNITSYIVTPNGRAGLGSK
jgi:hypothetical protein